MEKITSRLFTLDKYDFLKGLLIAVLSAVFLMLYSVVNAPDFSVDWFNSIENWKAVGKQAIIAGMSYLSYKFFTPQQKVETIQPGLFKRVPGARPEENSTINGSN